MTWFDTHCHLDSEHNPGGPDAALARAREAGVSAFLCVGVGGMSQAEQALAVAERHADVYASAGVHPHDAARDGALDFSALWAHPRLLAVGEVGLDYHYDHSPRDAQAEVFRRYIALARGLQKPLIIHTRSAAEDTLQILEAEGARDAGGVIHCFSEDRAFATPRAGPGLLPVVLRHRDLQERPRDSRRRRLGARRSHPGRDRQPVLGARAPAR